jgi:hypothetical protein
MFLILESVTTHERSPDWQSELRSPSIETNLRCAGTEWVPGPKGVGLVSREASSWDS